MAATPRQLNRKTVRVRLKFNKGGRLRRDKTEVRIFVCGIPHSVTLMFRLYILWLRSVIDILWLYILPHHPVMSFACVLSTVYWWWSYSVPRYQYLGRYGQCTGVGAGRIRLFWLEPEPIKREPVPAGVYILHKKSYSQFTFLKCKNWHVLEELKALTLMPRVGLELKTLGVRGKDSTLLSTMSTIFYLLGNKKILIWKFYGIWEE